MTKNTNNSKIKNAKLCKPQNTLLWTQSLDNKLDVFKGDKCVHIGFLFTIMHNNKFLCIDPCVTSSITGRLGAKFAVPW